MWLIYLNSSFSFTDAFVASRQLGAQILCISSSPPPKTFDSTLVDKIEVIHDWSLVNLIDVLKRVIPDGERAVVWTLDDELLPLAAELNELLGASSFPSSKTMWATKNKFLLRKHLEGTLLNPGYRLIHRREASLHPFVGNKVVIKPLEGYASIGVELLPAQSSHEEFALAASRSFSVLDMIANSIKGSRPAFVPFAEDVLLVESFVEGAEYSVEVFVTNQTPHIIGICGKSTMRPPYFEEVSYTMPAFIDSVTKNRLSVAAIQAIQSIGLTTGMAHVELKDGPEGPKVLDIGLRLGGAGLTHDLIKIAFGIDMVRAVLAELLGIPTMNFLTKTRNDTALLFLMQVGAGGLIVSIPHIEKIVGMPQAIRRECFVKVGDVLTPYPDYSGMPGFALFHIASQDTQAQKQAKELVDSCLVHLAFSYKSKPADI